MAATKAMPTIHPTNSETRNQKDQKSLIETPKEKKRENVKEGFVAGFDVFGH